MWLKMPLARSYVRTSPEARMKKPVVVTIPHQHTKLEAKKRIREGAEKLRPTLAGFASTIENEWDGDDMTFRMVVLKQEVAGRIHVMDGSVRVEVDLPWVLATIAEKVRGQIEKKGSQILIEKK
jgi:putative polyhydroxyalkanoate system protein